MSEIPETIGSQLRRERERQGLAVQKIAEQLRLDAWIVEALEADTYEGTVPPVYARGHLKKYSQLLGLAAVETPATTDARAPEAPLPLLRNNRHAMRVAPRVKKLPWVQAVAVLAVAATLAVFWWSPWKHRVTVQAAAAQPPVASSAATTDPGAAATDTAGTEGQPLPPSGPAASEAVAEAQPVDPQGSAESVASQGVVSLRLNFSANSWVDVRDATGRRLFVGHGMANTVKTLTGPAPLRVYLGFARGVEVGVNDQPVRISREFMKGEVARFMTGPDGALLPYPGNSRPRN